MAREQMELTKETFEHYKHLVRLQHRVISCRAETARQHSYYAHRYGVGVAPEKDSKPCPACGVHKGNPCWLGKEAQEGEVEGLEALKNSDIL